LLGRSDHGITLNRSGISASRNYRSPRPCYLETPAWSRSSRDFLRNGEDWERSRTSIPGVFVVKLPGRGSRGLELALEINPVDSQGQPKKKRGYMVRGKADLEELTKIISDPRLTRLAEALEAVNPKAVKSNSRMIEI
jgi:hypothetical protein